MKANLNIDYLILNVNLNNPKMDFDGSQNKEFSFLLLKYGTRNFQSIGEIYFRGNHFATITFNPYDQSIIKPDFAQIQLVNKFLYEPKNWLKNTIIQMMYFLGANVTGVNRLDIALDGLIGEIFSLDLAVLHGLVTFEGKYLICGKEKDFNCYTTTKNGLKGWTLGSKTADRFLRFYNKSKEIENNPKPWIHNYWNFKVEFTKEEQTRVWRMEYQLNRRFLRTLDKENWICIFDYWFIYQMFKTANEGFMDIRINQHKSRITDNLKCNLVDLNLLEKINEYDKLFNRFDRPESLYEGKKTRHLKITMKKFVWVYWRSMQSSSLPMIFVNKIMDCNRVYFEDLFFTKKIQLWVKEFEESEKLTYDFDWKQLQKDIKTTAGIEI